MKRRAFPRLLGIVSSLLVAGALCHSSAYAYAGAESTSLSAGTRAVKQGASTVIHVQPEADLDPAWAYEWSAQRGAITARTDLHTATYTATAGLDPGRDTITVQIWDHALPGPRTLLATRTIDVLVFKQFVILKADDWQRHYWNPNGISDRWIYYINYCMNVKNIKTSAGLINYSLDPDWPDTPVPPNDNALAPFVAYTKALNDSGYVEFWNHGHTHVCDPYEFRGSTYAFQTEHLAYGQTQAEALLGFTYTAFGAPCNGVDATTTTVIDESPDISVWLFGIPGAQKMVLERLAGEIEPVSAGVPSYQGFLQGYDPAADYAVLQLHPDVDTFFNNFDQFNLIIEYLLNLKATFIKPTEYYHLVHDGLLPAELSTNVAPHITTQPVSKTVNPSVDVMFNVTNTGSMPMTYQWKRDNVDIAGATLTFYVVPNATETEEGTYVCTLTNAAGTDTSLAATLSVNDAPEITEDPVSQAVDPGAPVTFTVTATGGSPLSYEWRKDGAAVSGATDASFTIVAVAKSDEGEYTCFVSNEAGTTLDQNQLSNPATLSVNGPPEVTDDPVSGTADFGETPEFFVDAIGSVPLSFQWRKDGDAIPDATSAVLTLAAVSNLDEGEYDCVVANSAGTDTSKSALLTVQDPAISSQPGDVYEFTGNPAQFEVVAGGTGSLSFRWFYGNTPLSDGGDISGSATPTLLIARALSAYQGEYHCNVTGVDGTVSSSTATLHISVPEALFLAADSASVRLGETTTIRIQPLANVDPEWSYQWHAVRGAIAANTDQRTATYTATAGLDPGEDVITVDVYDDTSTLLATRTAVVLVFKQFVILKSGTWNCWGYLSDNWKYYMNYIVDEKHIKTSAGVTTRFIDPSWNHYLGYAEFIQYTQARHDSGYVEFWNNGYDGSSGSGPPAWWEFKGTTYDFQKTHLDTGETLARTVLGFPFTAFSAPSNQFDSTTTTVVNESADLRVWLFGPTTGSSKMILNRIGGEIESSTGVPSFSKFMATYGPTLRYVVLQHNPAMQTFRDNFSQFQQIIDYLIAQKVTFILPSEYCYLIEDGILPSDPNRVPVFMVQPASQTVNPTQKVTFTATALGTTPMSYQWKKDEVDLEDATTSILVIGAAQESDEGSYVCTATNPTGSTDSVPAILTVNDPPIIVTDPSPVTADPGTTLTFTVEATGTAPLSYEWRKDSTPIPGATDPFFTIDSVTELDEGGYACYVSNEAGDQTDLNVLSAEALLTVNDPAYVIVHPESVTVDYGALTTFHVMAAGTLPIEYQWRRDGLEIPDATDTELAFDNCANAQEGDYDCIVTNSAGSAPSLVAQLVVSDPIIVGQPADVQVLAMSTAHFAVTAVGSGEITYQWFKEDTPLADGGNIDGANSEVLTVAAVADQAQGSYHCAVTGGDPTIMTRDATLEVSDPAFTSEPQSQTVNPGVLVSFSIHAVGTSPFSYAWRKDGMDIEGATNDVFVIPSAAETDEGGYSCLVTGPVRPLGVESVEARLSVNDPPLIETHPASQSVDPTDPVVFSVVASGTVPLSYAWYKEDVPIPGAIYANYSIPSVQPSDVGRYTCHVANEAGTASGQNQWSRTATLCVYGPPVIAAPPASQTVDPNRPVLFSVTATSQTPMRYQWRRKDVNIPGMTESSLVIALAQESDEGSYTCVVSNSAGDKTNTNPITPPATLTVNNPPVIVGQPASQLIVPGHEVTFSVTLEGTPPLSYQWMKGAIPLDGATLSSYTISSVATSDAGIYFCNVSNSAGAVTSDGAVLSVFEPARVVNHPVSREVNYGATVEFDVSAAGMPPVYYQWKKGGVDLADAERLSGVTTATFRIEAAENGDEGDYTCNVNNLFGAGESNTAVLTVHDPAITAQPQHQSVIGGHTARFSVGVAGSRPQYAWYKNGNPLTCTGNICGTTTATLTVAHCQIADEGSYHCVVSGGPDPDVTSQDATLEIDDPAIITQPQSRTVDPGHYVTFALLLDSSSTTPITYQWERNGAAIPGASGIVTSGTIANAIKHVIPHATESDEGSYVCLLHGFEDVISNAATLSVNDAPVISGVTVDPSSATIHVSNSASLTVELARGTAPISYQWLRDGVTLTENSRVSGTQMPTLSIGIAEEEDEGYYTCTVSNSAGSVVSTPVYLMVGELLAFTHALTDRKAYIGEDAQFAIQTVGGRGTLHYAWKFDNREKSIQTVGTDSPLLVVSQVTRADAGVYWSTVTDERDTYSTNTCALDVAPRLEILQHPHGGLVAVGSQHTFTVVTSGGFPPLDYEWRRSDVSTVFGTNETLTLPPLQEGDSGTYYVIVSDALSSVVSNTAPLYVGTGLPAAGKVLLGLLAGLCVVSGALVLRSRGRSMSS